ncbi:Ion-translocating oxidoreductase complex subunit E [Buchnera aphidicola (Eriosoma grossulariae)]|uniref:electron transport complex subunit RsxE n=1 Tax=Buchnera aphidicola TaxID=9 RepID=UPI003464A293
MFIKNEIKKKITHLIWENNSTLVQLLGLCPVLAITTNFVNSISLGIATTIVLIFTNFFIALFKKYIPYSIRIPIYIIVISSVVSIIDMLVHAYLFNLYSSLGVFIPLIVTNCIVVSRAELIASRYSILYSCMDGFFTGIGLTVSMIILGSIREIIGHGTLFYGMNFLFHFLKKSNYIEFFKIDYSMLMVCFPAGAFMILAFIIVFKSIFSKKF